MVHTYTYILLQCCVCMGSACMYHTQWHTIKCILFVLLVQHTCTSRSGMTFNLFSIGSIYIVALNVYSSSYQSSTWHSLYPLIHSVSLRMSLLLCHFVCTHCKYIALLYYLLKLDFTYDKFICVEHSMDFKFGCFDLKSS